MFLHFLIRALFRIQLFTFICQLTIYTYSTTVEVAWCIVINPEDCVIVLQGLFLIFTGRGTLLNGLSASV